MKSYSHFINRLCLLGMFLCSWMTTPAQAATEAWVRRYNSPEAGSLDYAFKVVTDTAGNVIVAGSSDDGFTGRDMLVIKYSDAGVPLWTNRYGGDLAGQVSAVDVDGNGNVFVAGGAAVVGYSSTGVALWTNRYGGQVRALAIDGSGNVFVTGNSIGIGSWDYMTVAYTGAGGPLWTNHYDLPENSDDRATAVAVDGNGNVFVTGNHSTVGYSGAGVPLWTNRNSGPASAVAVDSGGNVFVTGYVYTFALNNDYETVAYSPGGMPLWTNRYDGFNRSGDAASALAVDSSGNVFVTGNSGADYATVAYSGAGVPLWTNRYHGSQNGADQASSIAVDQSGNVFVTGSSSIGFGGFNAQYATVAYSNAGIALWTNRFDKPGNPPDSANSTAVNNSGDVFVTGHSLGSGGDPDAVTIAYSGAGATLWTNRYNVPGNGYDIASAMAVGGSGNVIVTGYSLRLVDVYYGGSVQSADFVTIAYSEAGVALWTNRYDGLGNRPDLPTAVAVDNNGQVLVTGSSHDGSNYDYATVAYSRGGMPLWTNRYNGLGYAGDEQAVAIAVDGSGNVFVTGSSTGAGFAAGDDFATIAYSGEGVALWTNRFNGLDNGGMGNGDDRAAALAVDNSGRVFVTGSSYGPGSSSDYATIAYSGAGVALWTNRYNGPGNGIDTAVDIAIDNQGNVLVTGSSIGSGGSYDYATVAYSGTGVALWTNRYNGPPGSNDHAYAMAVDNNGNVFVTGYSYGERWSDYATVAYSRAGVALWTNRYNGPSNSIDIARAVTADSSGNVFVTGWSDNGQVFHSTDHVTIAYSGAGVPLWTNRYTGPGIGGNEPARRGIAVGRDGAVYVAGSSDGSYVGDSVYDYATIKYVWRPHLVITPPAAGSSAVNLTLSGPQNSSWSVERSLTATGPWTSLGMAVIGANGLGNFQDANPRRTGAFYRTAPP